MNKRLQREILLYADLVTKGQRRSIYTAEDYENCMSELAKAEAQDGETPEQAFGRLVDDGDSRMNMLYGAARKVELEAEAKAAEDRQEAIESGRVAEDIRKRVEKRDRVWTEMEKRAGSGAQQGETTEAAMARMLEDDDPDMAELYRQYTQA